MRVHGSHRPVTAHDQGVGTPAEIEATGADYAAAVEALTAQVPAGHHLLSIVAER